MQIEFSSLSVTTCNFLADWWVQKRDSCGHFAWSRKKSPATKFNPGTHKCSIVLADASHCRMSQILKKESFFTKMFSLSLQAGIQQYRTVLKYPGNEEITESNGQTRVPDNLYTWKIGGEYTSGTNILGLVFFSVVLGITLAIMEEKGKPLIDFFTCLSEGRTKIVNLTIV